MAQNADEDAKIEIETTPNPISDPKSSTKSKERKNRKEKVKALAKVIVRRLPPSMSEEEFLKQIEPIPEHDYFYFVSADWTLGQNASCRAYINFCHQNDIFIFKDKFDGYVFVDAKGTEYPAIVEFAPFQGLPKGKARKKDNKANTIDNEPHYLAFLETLQEQDADGKGEMKMEYSFQLKDDQKITSTPLLEYIANVKQERRDERKRKVEDRKRQRDDEKQRKKNQVAKSIPKAIDEDPKENDDGIVVRTIKSRPLDRDRGRKDSKQEKERGAKTSSDAANDHRRAENEKRDAERLKKQKERQERRDAKRKEERERYRREKEGKAAKIDSNQNAIPSAATKDDKEKVKKYSESRRERRERRAEEHATVNAPTNRHSDKPAKPPKPDDVKSTQSNNDKKNPVDYQSQNSLDETKSNSSGENSASQKERSVQNIRNKFRPSLQIYQPGRRRSDASSTCEAKTKTGDKDKEAASTVDDGEQQPQSSSHADDGKPKTDKKVSRYTERRNKAREKRSMSDASDSKQAKDESTSGVANEANDDVREADAALSNDNEN